jgi:protein phosphatase
MKIELFQPLYIHEIGTRENQEDAIWPKMPTMDDRLFVLCDGMGGHEHGEVASQTVTLALGKWFAEHVDAASPLNDDQLRDAIEYAYTQLDKYADGSPRQMGTTLTLIYFGNSGVTAAHMGDSRIYHIRPSEGLLYVSRDHSLVFDLYQSGEITYDEMKNFKQKNIVTRAMTPGEEHRMRPDIIHITDVKAGDYFYSCSDGMLEQMTDNELFEIFASDITDEDKKQLLIRATTDSKDNHTAWIIPIKGTIAEEGDEVTPENIDTDGDVDFVKLEAVLNDPTFINALEENVNTYLPDLYLSFSNAYGYALKIIEARVENGGLAVQRIINGITNIAEMLSGTLTEENVQVFAKAVEDIQNGKLSAESIANAYVNSDRFKENTEDSKIIELPQQK